MKTYIYKTIDIIAQHVTVYNAPTCTLVFY